MTGALFECVPNISEGRDERTVDACAAAVTAAGARLLHRTSDRAHHRSVLTFAGSRASVLHASIALAGVTVETIDLRTHRGAHPRIGALDVLPFVPLRGATMRDAVELAREAAERIWQAYRVPCFLYGHAAAAEHRRNLAAVRAGEFEGLAARFESPHWAPDFGDVAGHERAGAIAVGARDVLIAFNVDLASTDLALAKSIARRLRERDGGLRTLRALGIRLDDATVQVSFNVTDYRATPLFLVVELVRRAAHRAGVELKRCELIGLAPREAFQTTASFYGA